MKPPLTAEQPIFFPAFLTGGGEAGKRIREHNWSLTPLGAVETWPQSLRSALSICLNSNFPIAIYWGSELTLLYNDAWSPIPGSKHPWALGKSAREVWPEIWDAIEPQFQKAFAGEPGGSKDALLPMHRHGYTEECYFDFTFTPIYGEGGAVEGVFNAVIETTKTILNERQLRTLRDLGSVDNKNKSADDVLKAAAQELEKNNKDFPFGILYKINSADNHATPLAFVGLAQSQAVFPAFVALAKPTAQTSDFLTAHATGQMVVAENNGRVTNLPKGGWDKEPTQFLYLPVPGQNRTAPVAVFLAALNPYRRFDEAYRQFAQLVADQVSTEVNNVLALEEEKKRAEALAEIDKAKTAFFTNISHEFRTPLTLMLGSVEETLNDPATDQRNRERMHLTHRSAVRLLKLVNNLLDFSRLEAGRVQAAYERTDVAALTSDLASNFRSAIENAGLAYNVLCQPSVQPVYVDRTMWEKIVVNLLSNAFKYTLNGSITVSLAAEAGRVVLMVKDTGVGIPEKELPKMFQRFHRVQNLPGRTFEGTGIGLSLVKELVELHGGSVAVTSEEGKGSAFTVAIPTGKSHLPADQVTDVSQKAGAAVSDAFVEEALSLLHLTPEENGKPAEASATVLVVDDNADMRKYIKGLLQAEFAVLAAGNGREALQLLATQKVDLVLSDVMMPVMDGAQLVQEIRKRPQTATLPVLLVSARAGEEARVEGYDMGADDYLVKPFSARELLARVKAQINIARKRNKVLADVYKLFDEVPFAVAALKGPDLVIEYINHYNLNIWQRRREDVLGKPLFAVKPELRDTAGPVHDEVYRTGCRFAANELPVVLAIDGQNETRYFNAIIDPMRNESGEIVGQIATSIDVTELVVARKKIEESEAALRKTKNQLDLSISAGKIGTWHWDLRRDKLTWSKEQLAIYGLEEREFGGTSLAFLQRMHPDDRAQIDRKVAEQSQSKDTDYNDSFRIVRKDGAVRWIQARQRKLLDENGEVAFITGVNIDVTEQKEAEEKIKEQYAFTQKLIESSPSLTYIYDVESGTNVYMSRQTQTILGYTETEIQEMGVSVLATLLHPDDRAIAQDRFQKILVSEEAEIFEAEYRMQRKDGSWVCIFDRARVFRRNEEGRPVQILGVATDISERKHLEETIRKQVDELENIYRNAPIGLALIDRSFCFVRINERLAEINGMPVAAHIGRPVHEIVPDLAMQAEDVFRRVFQTGEPVLNVEFRGETVAQPGLPRIWKESWHPIKDNGGETFAVSVVVEEVTEQRKAELALQASERKFRHLIQSNIVGVLFWDLDGGIVDANDAFLQILGYTSEDLARGLNWQELTPPQWAGKDRQGVADILATGRHQPYQKQYLHKNGTPVDVIIGSSAFDDTGNRKGVTFVVDITAQKEAEEKIKESERRFRLLAEKLPQLVWMNDADGKPEYVSSNWKEYSGISDSEAAWKWMVHPDDWDPIMQSWATHFATEQSFRYEVRLRNKAGEYQWFYSVAEPVKDENGKLLKWIGALTNIHEQKTLSENLERMVAERTGELQRSNEDLQQFAHVASHDLKEPVRKVMTFSSRLREELGNSLADRGINYLGKIEKAAERMYTMIDGVLMYSSLNAARQPVEPVNLAEVLRNIETDLEVLIGQKEASIAYGPLPVVEGSPVLLYQLFYNLVGNSLKFARAGVPPAITLQTAAVEEADLRRFGLAADRSYVKLVLQDNGIGFNQVNADRIFQTFSRLNAKDHYEGTGLGLALCKKIAERHGGAIFARGEEGLGAAFTVILPRTALRNEA